MTEPEPLEVGDIEAPASAAIELEAEHTDSAVVAIENLGHVDPAVDLEIYGEWGQAVATMTPENAEQLRDRLDEVIEVAREADQG